MHGSLGAADCNADHFLAVDDVVVVVVVVIVGGGGGVSKSVS